MSDIILKDPLGRPICLHERTWFGHIVVGHPDVKGHRSLVERTIVDPDEIRESSQSKDCRLYFGRGPRAGILMVVVADVNEGVVKTAHLAKRVSGGKREWSRPTP